MNFSPFSCPIFLGHSEARGRCSQGERVLYGRDLWRSGGTGKAEPTKVPGAGIGPKQCPGKCAAEKGGDTEVSEIASAGARGRQKRPQGEKTAGLAHTVWSKRALDSGLYSRV